MLARKSGSPSRLRSKKAFGEHIGTLCVCVCKSRTADEVAQLPFKNREGDSDDGGSRVGFICRL